MSEIKTFRVSEGSTWSVPKDWSSSTVEITVGPIEGMEHLCGGGGGGDYSRTEPKIESPEGSL